MLRRFMKGDGKVVPFWAAILAEAERFNVPPWVFEADCSQEWWAWISAYRDAQARARPSESQKKFLQEFMR